MELGEFSKDNIQMAENIFKMFNILGHKENALSNGLLNESTIQF